MAVDVSGITSALINVPGQQVQGIQQQLEQAFQDRQAMAQQKLQNEMLAQKMHLEEKVKQGEIDLKQLETNAKQMDYVRGWAQGMLVTKDPAQRDMLLKQGISDAQKLSIPREGQLAMLKAAQEPEFAGSLIARGMAAKDFYKEYLSNSTQTNPSQAQKQYDELIARWKDQGRYIPGASENAAEGIAYHTLQKVTDDQGNIFITDLRAGGRRVSPQVQSQVEDIVGSKDYQNRVPSSLTAGKTTTAPATKVGEINVGGRLVAPGHKAEIKMQENVRALKDDVVKAKLPDTESTLQPIEAILQETYYRGKDVPGFGPVGSKVPDWAVDEQGRNLRRDFSQLMNTTLHNRSGAAVTPPELQRLQEEFSQGMFKTDQQFAYAIKRYRTMLEDFKKAEFAGYDPEVVRRYQEQGGLQLVPQKAQASAPTAGPAAQGKVVTEEQIRADAVKYKWSSEQTEAAIKKYVRK